MRHVIGVDLGGTKTAAGVVAEDGTVLFSAQVPTLHRDGAEAILDATAELVRALAARAADGGTPVDAVGMGSAGVIDSGRGTVVSATDAIAGWAGTRLKDGLAARLGLPVAVVNDVHAHALGEAWRGAAAGTDSSLLVAFGTGVGGSMVLGGRPLLGHRFVGGHVGHLASPFAYSGGRPLPCTCGKAGHLEVAASGPALHQAYLRLGGRPSVPDTRAVFELARAGDRTALLAVDTGARAAGQAVGGLVNVLDPQVVVVSGGLADAGELWWNPLLRAVRAELLAPLADVPVVPAELGSTAAVIGAARLVLTGWS